MGNFRTDYKDDKLLVATNDKRKYRVIENADGTVSFEDVTVYEHQGDHFGAEEVNAIHAGLNKMPTFVLDKENQVAYITTNQG